VELHHGTHTRSYYEKTSELAARHDMSGRSLAQIIRDTAQKRELEDLFNNAAQAWNHTFYWETFTPGGARKPAGEVGQGIASAFGSWDKLRERMVNAGVSVFGSGYVWLMEHRGELRVLGTPNAVNPLALGAKPLLTVDVWEHAYYLDYQNRRKEHLQAVLDNLVNWDVVARRMAA